MQIKRFEARNMTMALKMVKDELGQDAVILSARSLKSGSGFLGNRKSVGVEVTAAIDANRTVSSGIGSTGQTVAAPCRPPAPGACRLPGRDRRIEPALGAHLKSRATGRNTDTVYAWEAGVPGGALSGLHQHLSAQEMDRKCAERLIEGIQKTCGADDWEDSEKLQNHFSDILEELGVRIDPLRIEGRGSKNLVFVGPPGVGKTTTLAKIAADLVTMENLRVALITLDDYRIAASEQLKVYAGIIGVPLEIVRNAGGLKTAVKKHKRCDCLLIDTPGIGRSDRKRLDELGQLLGALKSKQVHLLLSGCTKERDLAAQSQLFRSLAFDAVIFTKIDESETFGNMLNLLTRSKYPLSLMTNGQRIPEDFRRVDMPLLLSLLFPAGIRAAVTSDVGETPVATQGEAADGRLPYAANLSSDVYHRAACKWTRKIKPAHRLEFRSIEEAEAQGFLPCGNCNPNRTNRVEEPQMQRYQRKLAGCL
jgi:flagellar biosynthesis protein FlhF